MFSKQNSLVPQIQDTVDMDQTIMTNFLVLVALEL
jgi:hypothetical protein